MKTDDQIAEALDRNLTSPNVTSPKVSANVVDGLYYIGDGLYAVAKAIRALGNNDADTNFGAIEAFSMKLDEGLEKIANAIAESALKSEE